MLELNISDIEHAAAKQSYGYFSLCSSGLSNVNVDNQNFIVTRHCSTEYWRTCFISK